MKTNAFIGTTAAVLLLTLSQIHGQALPQSPMARGPVPPGREARPGAGLPGPGRAGMVALTTVSGTVQQLTGNDESILDGFTLGTGSSTVVVRFPSRLGQSISDAVKAGSSVSVTGFTEVTPEGESIFRLNSLTSGKTTIADTPPTVPASPAVVPTASAVTVQGKVAEFQLDRQGRTKGLLLADQTLVKIPPHVADQLATMAPKGSTVSITGYARPLGDGQVQLKKRTVLEATQLTVNGQTFLVR